MKKCLLVLSSFLVLFAQAQKTTKKPVPQKTTTTSSSLKNLNDSASYAIGVSVANFYNQQGLKNINSTLVARAISDVYKKKTLLSESQCNDVMMTLMNRAQEDQNKAVMQKAKPNIEAGEAFLTKNKSNPAIKTTASGLQYEVITEGKGPKPLAT